MRFIVLWVVSVTAITAAFGFHLTVRIRNMELGYQLSALRERERELLEQKRQWEVEVATLRQADRIEAVARGTLAMDNATAQRVITVGAGPVAQRISGRLQ